MKTATSERTTIPVLRNSHRKLKHLAGLDRRKLSEELDVILDEYMKSVRSIDPHTLKPIKRTETA